MNNELSLTVITTTEEFHSLRDEWNNLLEISDQNTIFLRWEWLFTWWQVYENSSKRLYLCIAREKGQLVGIAPLYLKKNNRSALLLFLGANIVCSDYLDFILLKNRENAILSAMTQFLKNTNDWDVLSLRNMPSWSTNLLNIRAFFHDYRIIINEKNTACPYINLQAKWEVICDNFDSKLNNIITRKIKKLKNHCKVSYFESDSKMDLTKLVPHFLNLNRLRFEKKGMQSPFSDNRFADFHKRIIASLNENDMITFGFLKANDEFIAGIYLFKYNNKYMYYQSGFNPAWERFSPGTLLFHYVIKDAHERGISEFDFLQGNESYKNNWTKTFRYNARLQIYNNTMASHYLYWLARIGKLKCLINKYIKPHRLLK